METKTLKEKLKELNACEEAREWASDKSIQEVWETCHRGDWMLWLFARTNQNDFQILTLAKGHCANTVRHLMKDERSRKAVDAAILFGHGEITKEELIAAYAAADDAADDADDAAYASAYAASAYAAYAASAYAASAYAAYAAAAAAANAADAAAAYAADAKKDNQILTADICRKYLPIPTI